MTGRLVDALLALSPRERLGLAAMALGAVPLGLVLGVLLPLQERADAALAARMEAVALRVWVGERAAEAAALAPVAAPRDAPAPIGTGGLEESLIAAGLRGAVAELSADGAGIVSLRFDDVAFDRLADWLTGAEASWGYDIAAFRLEATDRPNRVAATLRLAPPEG